MVRRVSPRSYSNDVKNELARIIPERDCCRKAELAALYAVSGRMSCANGITATITTENAATARKVFKIYKEIYNIQPRVKAEKRRHFNKDRVYIINTGILNDRPEVMRDLGLNEADRQTSFRINWSLLGKVCCRRAFLRGLFLGSGFINHPGGDYHLEITVGDKMLARDIKKLMGRMNISARITARKNNLLIYVKESEKIVDFLRIVGASKALLDFENVRIIKAVRNNVNRQVNCETANLGKTIDASMRQIESIKKLIKNKGLEHLTPRLRELALLRIDYPDYTLAELGAMMNPPLSKSGVAYRMRKLEHIVGDLVENQE